MRTLLAALFVATMCLPVARPAITGGVRSYEVAEGESLTSIAARFGVEVRILARDNGLRANARLEPGDQLIVDHRHVAPATRPDGIVLNVPQRMLFVFRGGEPVQAFPVAVGRSDWRTPIGSFEVAVKETDPVWDVPVSIQAEMAREGKQVLTKVPPGPENPLGDRWLGLTAHGVGIHGTNVPSSVYRFTTHGCIRLHPDDIAALFDLVSVGTPVEVIYEPVLLAAFEHGPTFLEVHRDAYSRTGRAEARVNDLLRGAGLERLIGSAAVRKAVADRAGRAVAVEE
jgi:L,D-transpeptidase ErfK/SrfK